MADHLDDSVFGLSNQTVGFGENIHNVEDSLSSMSSNIDLENSRRIFWAVNFFVLFLIILSAISCIVVSKYYLNGNDRRAASDQFYQARLRRHQALERARNEEPLDKRQANLHASFARNDAQMTVKESDLIGVDPSIGMHHDDLHQRDGGESDIEMGGSSYSMEEDNGQLKLGNGNTVPNCCAICLDGYEEGDVVVWSSNPKCIHAFHRECVTDWLIKMQPETPCPCCRQEFTDLEKIREVKQVWWLPNVAFDFNVIRFS